MEEASPTFKAFKMIDLTKFLLYVRQNIFFFYIQNKAIKTSRGYIGLRGVTKSELFFEKLGTIRNNMKKNFVF